MTITAIAKAFSNGEFEKIYPFIADNAIWVVVGEGTFIGKDAIRKNCEQVSNYFKSVTTNFNTINVVTQDNNVVINGTAEFLKDNTRVSFVNACDVYEFNEHAHIQRITAYCIQLKIGNTPDVA